MNLKEKTVVIDNKIYRYSKIVMLESNNKPDEDDILYFGKKLINGSRISIPNNSVGFINPIDKKWISIAGINRFKVQHLYFLSTDKICEGDIGYIPIEENGIVGIISYDKEYKTWDLTTKKGVHYPFSLPEYIKKVISSTDSELFTPIELKDNDDKFIDKIYLPKPSEQFLQVYIDAYNKDEKIEECLVEYNKFTGYDEDGVPMDQNGNIFKNIPKLTNGFITTIEKEKLPEQESNVVHFPFKIGTDTITLYGAGTFHEEKLVLDKTKAKLLFIELWKFLEFDKEPIMYTDEDLHEAYCAGADFDIKSLDKRTRYYMFNDWFEQNKKK